MKIDRTQSRIWKIIQATCLSVILACMCISAEVCALSSCTPSPEEVEQRREILSRECKEAGGYWMTDYTLPYIKAKCVWPCKERKGN